MDSPRFLKSPGTRDAIACAIALAYITVIAAIAHGTGAFYILFPELGALAFETITRPYGRWASAPIHLATTPFLTALVGTVITRMMPYEFASILLTVGSALVIIIATGSPIVPAISAGLLPLVVGITSWGYPGGILLASLLLVGLVLGWQTFLARMAVNGDDRLAAAVRAENRRPSLSMLPWVAVLFAFITVQYGLVLITGMRFVMFPPIIVICTELLSDPDCPWTDGMTRMPLLLFVAAFGGLVAIRWIGTGPGGAFVAMAWGIGALRVFGLHLPPGLAVALLPMVMRSPTFNYPFAALLGTSVLILWATAYRRWIPGSVLIRRLTALSERRLTTVSAGARRP